MQKSYVSVELADGQTISNERILIADKLKLEQAMRANKWKFETHGIKTSVFTAWAVLSRLGKYTMPFETFEKDVIDVAVATDESDADESE